MKIQMALHPHHQVMMDDYFLDPVGDQEDLEMMKEGIQVITGHHLGQCIIQEQPDMVVSQDHKDIQDPMNPRTPRIWQTPGPQGLPKGGGPPGPPRPPRSPELPGRGPPDGGPPGLPEALAHQDHPEN